MDILSLYTQMVTSRRFEEALKQLWDSGLISGEMHLGTGEEAILAGVVSQLLPGDALAVDHRSSAAFFMRGVDPVLLLREMLGQPDGLCGGQGGHMHLYSKEFLAASSGIVGAAGPRAVGFGLAAQTLRPGSITVAFFGEGAMNQGMLLESIHLAAEWCLPILFVCKDDGWAITTPTNGPNNHRLRDLVRGLGVEYIAVDGLAVERVWEAAYPLIQQARSGNGPAFLHASCIHLEGHLLGYQLLRILRNPWRELPRISLPLIRSFFRSGGERFSERLAGMRMVLAIIMANWRDGRFRPSNDPIVRARNLLALEKERLEEIDQQIESDVAAWVAEALAEGAG